MFKQTHDTHTHMFNPDFKPINHVFAFPSRLSTTSGETSPSPHLAAPSGAQWGPRCDVCWFINPMNTVGIKVPLKVP